MCPFIGAIPLQSVDAVFGSGSFHDETNGVLVSSGRMRGVSCFGGMNDLNKASGKGLGL
jgi:hypothetical protein